MPTPSEYKTAQARILVYAEAIGWSIVPSADSERRQDAYFAGQCEGSIPYVRTRLHKLMTTKTRGHELELSA